MPPDNDWISAAEISEYEFCSRAFRMRRSGVRPVANEASRASGLRLHRTIGKRVRHVERAQRASVTLLTAFVTVVALLVFYWLQSR